MELTSCRINEIAVYKKSFTDCKANRGIVINKLFLEDFYQNYVSKPSVIVSGTKEFVKFYNSLPDSITLRKKLDQVMDDLKKKPTMGDKIQVRLFPAKYVRKYGIRNLFRYAIGSNYRVLYTLVDRVGVLYCVILDVLNHKEYDELFGYKTS